MKSANNRLGFIASAQNDTLVINMDSWHFIGIHSEPHWLSCSSESCLCTTSSFFMLSKGDFTLSNKHFIISDQSLNGKVILQSEIVEQDVNKPSLGSLVISLKFLLLRRLIFSLWSQGKLKQENKLLRTHSKTTGAWWRFCLLIIRVHLKLTCRKYWCFRCQLKNILSFCYFFFFRDFWTSGIVEKVV